MSKIKKTALMKIYLDLHERKAKYERKLNTVATQGSKIWNLLSEDERDRVNAILEGDTEEKVDDEEVDEDTT